MKGTQGKGGGYRLTRKVDEYKIGEILRLTEKELAPVSCLAEGASECERRSTCKTIDFWEGLNDVVNNYLDSKTILTKLPFVTIDEVNEIIASKEQEAESRIEMMQQIEGE